MDIKLETLTANHTKQICNWKYENEYSIYNFPDWDVLVRQNWTISIDAKREEQFSAVTNETGELCGYIRFVRDKDFVTVGLGLKPNLCGQGIGNKLMELLKDECKRRFNGLKITLEVRSFNLRAIKCYEKSGFIITDRYFKDTLIGNGEFVKMELNFTD